MSLIRTKPKNPAEKLRFAVEAMPGFAKEAMLRGMDENTIIAGAYVDPSGSGGICPMLAAHRNGGRISLSSFARCWDIYTDARRPRVCTERELRTLRCFLELSLAREGTSEDTLANLAGQIRDERTEMRASAPLPELEIEATFDFADAADSITDEELAAISYEPVELPGVTADEEGRYSAAQLLAPDPRAARKRAAAPAPISSTVDRPFLQEIDSESLFRSDERRSADQGAWMRPTRSYADYRDDVAAAAEQLTEQRASEILSDRRTADGSSSLATA